MPRPASFVAVLALTAGLIPRVAAADRVTVKGVVLEGSVKAIDAKQLGLETVYGKGDITIKLADVEAIQTDGDFYLWHDDDIESVGRVVGVSGEKIQLEPESGEALEVPTSSLLVARRAPGPEADWIERAHVELPYWSGSVDLAFSATQATDDTLALATGRALPAREG